MKWILLYIIVGMIYSALTMKKRGIFFVSCAFDKPTILKFANEKDQLTDDEKTEAAVVTIMVLVVSFIVIFIWPFLLVAKLAGVNPKPKFKPFEQKNGSDE